MSFEADLARLDRLAAMFPASNCRCRVLCVVIDKPLPPPCPQHGYAGGWYMQINIDAPVGAQAMATAEGG